MAARDIKYDYIWETGNQKYFLVRKTNQEFFVFRTPGKTKPESKDRTTLGEWEGETAPWGGVPRMIREWIMRKNLRPSEKDQKTILPK